MKKMIGLALSLGFASLLIWPGAAMSRVYGSIGYSPASNVYLGTSRGFDFSDARFWGGWGGLSLGFMMMPFIVDPPFMVEPPFSQPSYAPRYDSQPVYAYPPEVPPGLCRWERAVLDGSGWPLLDASGMPVKEYTIGSCSSPPR